MFKALRRKRKNTLSDVLQQNIDRDNKPAEVDIWFYLWVECQLGNS